MKAMFIALLLSFIPGLSSAKEPVFPFTYPLIRVIEVKDADTFFVEYQVMVGKCSGCGVFARGNLRLHGVDAWETSRRRRTVLVTDLEKEMGEKAKVYARDLVSKARELTVTIVGIGVYGRALGNILVDGKDLGELLLENCHAIPYDGAKYGEIKDGCVNPRGGTGGD